MISYLSYNDDVPDLVLTSSGLVGGQTGTSPTVSFSELRKHSTNLLYNPVDDNFMFTASSGPNVLVEVNGLLGVCTNDCAYTFETNVPEITAQTISTSTLTLTISDPLSQNYPASDFTIKLDEQDCTSVSGTMASLTCTLTTNSDGTPTIRAGSHNAYVFIKDVGIVQPQSGLATLDETLSISALAPSSVEANGGKVVVISGTGLPSDKS